MATPKTTSRPAVDGGDDALPPPARRVRVMLFRVVAVAVAVVATLGPFSALVE
ncbi:hypothetical protein [uncultured Mycobacterium sp.]|uniref:hypothetical protein n=1 Tax=uncultured Mycobacterium sp. TaxID=171292 RepID=UPI0035C9921F